MAVHGTDHGEGNDAHDDQGLGVGAQRHREQRVEDEQRGCEEGHQARHGFTLLALRALQAVGDARMVAHDGLDRSGAEARDHLVRRDLGAVDVGGHIDDAPAVRAPDGGESAAQPRLGDRREGNFRVVQRPEGTALPVGVADHHAHIVAPSLHPLDLLTVERLPHLAREIAQRDPQRLPGRQDVQLELALARAERVGDVDHAGVLDEFPADSGRDLAQLVEGIPLELDVDLGSHREQRGFEDQLHRVGHGTRELPPAVGDVARLDVPRFARRELHRDLAEVGADARHRRKPGRPEAGTGHRVAAHRSQDVEHGRRPRGFLGQLRGQCAGCPLQVLHRVLRHSRRGSEWHRELRGDLIGLQGREEREGQAPAREHCERHDQRGEGQR